jgi:hypothetical protein
MDWTRPGWIVRLIKHFKFGAAAESLLIRVQRDGVAEPDFARGMFELFVHCVAAALIVVSAAKPTRAKTFGVLNA